MNFSELWMRFSPSKIILYADFIDPFCYIGFHNLCQALQSERAEIDWRGFELNPETPPGGMLLQTAENSDLRAGMWASVRAYGERSGLSLIEPRRVPNTRRAQLLVRAARGAAIKKSLIDRLYRAYFIDQKDIGESSVLRAIATMVQMTDRDSAGPLADPFPSSAPLERYRQEAQQKAFPGMPGFVYHGQAHFGALSADHWKTLLRKTHGKDKPC